MDIGVDPSCKAVFAASDMQVFTLGLEEMIPQSVGVV